MDIASGGSKCVKPSAREVFKDCAECPEMVVVPAGSFMMSSPTGEGGRRAAEGPQHKGTIPVPFAVGKFEVTRRQFEQFVKDTSYPAAESCRAWEEGFWGRELKVRNGITWRNPGFTQSANHPVVCVSWNDAAAYAKWLSDKTGKPYRLLSEAEWEYVARSGTTGPFGFESPITMEKANYKGNETFAESPRGKYRKRTVPVDSFASNPWGLYQVHGNVFEWVSDCWNDSYGKKPYSLKITAAAWKGGDCKRRVLHGGSWNYSPKSIRLAARNFARKVNAYDNDGFRLARTLAPSA